MTSATIFLLLIGDCLLKTARGPLVLIPGGAEVKQYAAAGQATLPIPTCGATRRGRHGGGSAARVHGLGALESSAPRAVPVQRVRTAARARRAS